MIIRPKKRENPYAQIDNRALNDKRLSWRARGILAYLLSKPPDWKVISANIVAMGTEGRDAVRACFKELAHFGYALLVPTRDGKEWHVFEEPQPENPSLGHALKKPTTEKANVEKAAPTNTDLSLETEPATKTDLGRVEILSKQAERIAAIFNRRKTTNWSDKELKAWKQLTKRGPLDDDELAMVERYYEKSRKKPDNICRRDLLTLLNNWTGEVDRARSWCEKNPLPSQRKIVAPKVAAPPPEPEPVEPIAVDSPQGQIIRQLEKKNHRLPAGMIERDGFFVHSSNGAH